MRCRSESLSAGLPDGLWSSEREWDMIELLVERKRNVNKEILPLKLDTVLPNRLELHHPLSRRASGSLEQSVERERRSTSDLN